jgi:thioredoxin 1
MIVIDVSDNNKLKEIIGENKFVLVDFWATWCGPCRMLSAILEEAEKKMADVRFVKVNVDDAPEMAAEHSVQTLPTILLFKDGAEVDSKVGFMSASVLKSFVDDCR